MLEDSMQARVFQAINQKRLRPWHNEEEVRLAWIPALESELKVDFEAERSKHDSSYNNVIIEFKGPGLFNGNKESPKFKEAVYDRLFKYIKRAALKNKLPTENYIGIAIDGEHICFARVENDEIHTEHLLPFSEYSVGLVLEAIKSRSRRDISAQYLLQDFGHSSKSARNLMQSLSNALAIELSLAGNSKIKMLFEEWKTLYGQVADLSISQKEEIEKDLGFTWDGNPFLSISGRLFVLHTYNSLIIKLLAAEIVSSHGLTSFFKPAQIMSIEENDDRLLDFLKTEIEGGDIFSKAGLKGFIEEILFSWYIDYCKINKHNTQILKNLRQVLAAMSLYKTEYLSHTQDVLRDLYQGLIPGRLRQSLGEFYTPDWLVDFTLQEIKVESWLEKRVLDPTCGSGAFLLGVMRRIKKEALEAGWSSKQTLQHICENVWGFDLNPLAVQTARVNFLMEIADLWRNSPGLHFEVPILLADAIYSPSNNGTNPDEPVHYRIGSHLAGLDVYIPPDLAFKRNRLEQVFDNMGYSIEKNYNFVKAQENLIASGIISKDEALKWYIPLETTYNQILKLHKKNWNGIWFKLVKNFFWSANAGRFDILVGNPPWVRWSKLPDLYKDRVKPTCIHYGIFSNNPLHGGNELDISAMITYTTADKWLKTNGMIAFILTGTIFKNPSSAGFRKFQIESKNKLSLHLSPLKVIDMKSIKPFSDASNHTVVAFFSKTVKPGEYPVPYEVWEASSGYTKSIPVRSSLEQVMLHTKRIRKEAVPVEALGSPWAVLNPGRYKLLSRLSGNCSWLEGRKGITTDLNGVFFVPIISKNSEFIQIKSQPSSGKKSIGPAKTAWVEPTLIYPLIKGASDFSACYIKLDSPDYNKERLYTFLPNTGILSSDYRKAETLMNSPELSKTRAWFSSYKDILVQRSTFRRQMKNAPPYAVYNVGYYTFQPWKVIWPEMSSRFYAAVAGSREVPNIGNRPYIPDHKIYFVAFEDKFKAYFVCGLLNSSFVREWIESHVISIQIGNIFKHLNLPVYNDKDTDHSNLSRLVESAHTEHDFDKRSEILKKIEDSADKLIETWLES